MTLEARTLPAPLDAAGLPEPVVARLAAAAADDARAADTLARLAVNSRGRRVAEARPAPTLELRDEADEHDVDRFGLHGYATVYEHRYDVAGGPDAYGWVETIADGAFAASVALGADVRFLVDHEGTPLARSTSGTLALESDDVGLRMTAPDLDLDNPVARMVRSAVRRGDVDAMSVAFRAIRQEWSEDYTERRITEGALVDVSVVTYPANPATVVAERDAGPTRSATPAPADARLSLRLARAQADALR